MVSIDEVKVSGDTIKGKFIRVGQIQEFKTGRCRIGLLFNTDQGELWFNLYGTRGDLNRKLQPLDEGDVCTITYKQRNYITRDGKQGVARDIKDFTIETNGKFQKNLTEVSKGDKLNLVFLETSLRDCRDYIDSVLYVIERLSNGENT